MLVDAGHWSGTSDLHAIPLSNRFPGKNENGESQPYFLLTNADNADKMPIFINLQVENFGFTLLASG